MKKTNNSWFTLIIVSGLLAGSVARADLIAPPKPKKVAPAEQKTDAAPQPQTLTGTLAWKTTPGADGTPQKTALQLITPEKKVVDLLPAASLKNHAEYDALVGKTVEVKIVPQSAPATPSQPKTIIRSITAIKETPRSKS
jgi:hypothetical protein